NTLLVTTADSLPWDGSLTVGPGGSVVFDPGALGGTDLQPITNSGTGFQPIAELSPAACDAVVQAGGAAGSWRRTAWLLGVEQADLQHGAAGVGNLRAVQA